MVDGRDPGASAERAYLQRRLHDVRRELEQRATEVNLAFGMDIQPAGATPAELERLKAWVVEKLTAQGNPGLAARWLAADAAWEDAERHLGRLNEQRRFGFTETTEEEQSAADEQRRLARDAMNDALEAFERVNAEVGSWLAGREEE